MNVSKDDYVLLNLGQAKPQLALVLNPKGQAYLDSGAEKDDAGKNNVRFVPEQVVANLGPDPKVGQAFGVKIEPYIKSFPYRGWGTIHLFRKLDKLERKALKSGLDRCEKQLKAAKLWKALPIDIYIRPKKGKYAGFYKFKKNKDGTINDSITLNPETLKDPLYNSYIFAHEVGHAIWFRFVPDHIKAKWLKLYTKRVTVTQTKEKDLKELLRSVTSYNGSLRDYQKELADENELVLIKEIYSYISKKHRISKEDLEMILTEDRERVKDLWPSHAELSETRADVTEYAMVNVREFFAEAFAYHVTGKQLPQDVIKGMSFTVKRLQNLHME